MGLLVIVGWAFVGLIVAAVEKALWPSRDADGSTTMVLCVAGAVAGGFIGQTFGWYVGQPPAFVWSAAGAGLLLSLYRSRSAAKRTHGEVAPGASVVRPHRSAGARFVEALFWGALCAPAVAVSSFLGLLIGQRLYPQRYSQIPVELLFIPLGLILGVVAAATTRLARPQWTAVQMVLVVTALPIGYGALMVHWGRANAKPAHVTITFEPDPATAMPCDASACPPAQPPLQWTVQGSLHVQETAGLGGTVGAIEMTSYTDGRFGKGSISGPHVLLRADQITGAHRVRPNEVASYPLRYSYRTDNADSRRTVTVMVQFIDAAGHPASGGGRWTVH